MSAASQPVRYRVEREQQAAQVFVANDLLAFSHQHVLKTIVCLPPVVEACGGEQIQRKIGNTSSGILKNRNHAFPNRVGVAHPPNNASAEFITSSVCWSSVIFFRRGAISPVVRS